MTLIGYVFPKLQTTKDFVRQMSKRRHFRTSFDSQHVKGSQILVKSAWPHFYYIFSSLWGKLNWNIFLLVICKIFGLFGNTMTADNKYSLRSSENLLQPIQMKLSKNQRTFSNFFAHFWNKQQILNILKKKDYPHNLYIFEITEYERYT